MRLKSFFLAGLFTLGTLTLWAAPPTDVVKIEPGQIKGAISNGIVSFKGIPLAQPPVGDLRWRAPQPAKPWTGVRPATAYGSDCMQLPFPSDAAPLGVPPAEDCLYVNVWAPAQRSAAKLPVLIWIYGGGFVNGGSSPSVYDGTHFAEHGLVFVSFNYRLGRFGYFGFPALTAEHPDELKGNYGYMDQIAALKWVKKNIAAFGGDPGNVTIFGESAGGGSVLTLLTSPLSQGLFHRAIVMSGGGRELLMGPRYLSKPTADGRPSAEQIGVNFAKSVGVEGTDAKALAELRKVSAEKVVAGMNMASMGQAAETYAGPLQDGGIVRESPQSAILSGRWAKVPVMIGSTSADIGFPRARTIDELFAQFGDNAEKAKALYNPENSDNVMLVGWRVGGDQMMGEPARFVARTVAAQGIPSYYYRFSYVAESLRATPMGGMGAMHASEIPYFFRTVNAALKDKLAKADEAISDKAIVYFSSFAKNGNPSGEGVPQWPVYEPKTDTMMDFTTTGPVAGPDPRKERLDLIEALATKKPAAAQESAPAGK